MNATANRRLSTLLPATRLRAGILAAILLCAPVLAGAADHPPSAGLSASDALAILGSLVGKWTGTTGQGAPITIEFSKKVGGTTLMETQSPSTADEMVSVYSRQGDELALTHYCPMGPMGNQPHMRLDRAHSTRSILRFEFASLTNLDPGKDMHVHDGVIRIIDANHIERDWDIYNNGHKAGTEHFVLTRAADA